MIDVKVRHRLAIQRKQLEEQWQASDLHAFIKSRLLSPDVSDWADLLGDTAWTGAFARFCADFMAADPLTPFPFRFKLGDENVSLSIADDEQNILTLHCFYKLASVDPQQSPVISIADDRRALGIVSGGLTGRMFRADPENNTLLPVETFEMTAGQWRIFPERTQLVFDEIEAPLILVQMSRRPAQPDQIMVYDIATGALVGRKWGNDEASRSEMLIELLGAMQHRQAAPILAELSRNGPAEMRWHALRHALALDSEVAIPELARMRRDDDPQLRHLAAQTWDRLCRQFPQLAEHYEGVNA